MLTLKENQSYAITMRYLKNRMEYMGLQIRQEIHELGLVYALTWYDPAHQLIKETLADLNACAEGLRAGNIPVSYVVNFVDNSKVMIDNALTKYAKRLLKKQENLSQNAKKFEPLVLSIVEFQKFNPKAIIESNLKGRQEKLEQLSEGIPTYPQIANVLRIEELQQHNLVGRIVKAMTKQAEVANETEEAFDFEKNYGIQGNQNLEFAHGHVFVRLDIYNPHNKHFLDSVLPKTNAKFMDRNHDKILATIEETVG